MKDAIRAARDAMGWSQDELARAVGTSRQTVNKWENGKAKPEHENLLKLEEALELPTGALALSKNVVNVTRIREVAGQIRRVPLIDLRVAGRGVSSVAHDVALFHKETREVSFEASDTTFAFQVLDDSMAPKFLPGDEIIIDPSVSPEDGDCVVAELLEPNQQRGEGESTFRTYRARSGGDPSQTFDLVAENPGYVTFSVTSERPGWIVGTMAEHRRFGRR